MNDNFCITFDFPERLMSCDMCGDLTGIDELNLNEGLCEKCYIKYFELEDK
jgi:hypothetical protein